MRTTSKVHGELMAARKAKRAAKAERTEARPALDKARRASKALDEAAILMREAADLASNGPRTGREYVYSGGLVRYADQLASIREMVTCQLLALADRED
jgi:hypothetical protein